MKKIKISSLWCGWISTSLIVNLIKDITKREIELVHPSDSDILFSSSDSDISFSSSDSDILLGV